MTNVEIRLAGAHSVSKLYEPNKSHAVALILARASFPIHLSHKVPIECVHRVKTLLANLPTNESGQVGYLVSKSHTFGIKTSESTPYLLTRVA